MEEHTDNKESFKVHSNGMDFYCERYGDGSKPYLVLVPDGINDCGQFEPAARLLMKDFTVLTFDMRGGSRSMPPVDQAVTPKLMADDIAGILKGLNIQRAHIYGCSSGGQAVLSLGVYYPELCINIIAHEAALQLDDPLPMCGYGWFKAMATYDSGCEGFSGASVEMVGDRQKWDALGEEFKERVNQNNIYWMKWYLGSSDQMTYNYEQLNTIPNLEFSIGTWSPSWLTYSNYITAMRGNRPIHWMNCSHHPQITNTEEWVKWVTETCHKYN